MEMIKNQSFKIIKATVEDRERIITFMRKHFYKYEPLNASLGVTRGHFCTTDVLALHSLDEGYSLLAVTKDTTEQEEIIGIALNGECTPNDDYSGISDDRCQKYKTMLHFLATVDKAADIWTKTGVDKALDMHVLSVDSEVRRNGLARELVDYSCKMAAENGFPLFSITCTSSYSARLVEKLGMKRVYSLRYDEHLGDDNLPVFRPPAPHEAVKVYVQRLSKQ